MYDGTSKNSGNDNEIEYPFDCSQKAFYETFIQTGAELQQNAAWQKGIQAYWSIIARSISLPNKIVFVDVLSGPCRQTRGRQTPWSI